MKIKFQYPLVPLSRYKLGKDGFYKPDSLFLDESYKAKYHSWHQAVDLNGKHGGNTDKGNLIYAMFDGQVDYIGAKRGTGIILKIRANEFTRRFWSKELKIEFEVLDYLYMHLDEVKYLQIGDCVKAGEVIGTIGTAENDLTGRPAFSRWYLAHLHLEIIKAAYKGYTPQAGRSKKEIQATHVDPMLLLKSGHFAERTNLHCQ